MLTPLALCLAAFPGWAAETTTNFRIQGTVVGKNVTSWPTATTFRSRSTLEVGSVKVLSEMDGATKDGKIVQFTLHEKASTVEGTITLENGKISVVQNGKKVIDGKESPFKSSAYMTNYHPVTWSSLYKEAQASKNGEIGVSLVNGLTTMPWKFKQDSRVVTTEKGAAPLSFLNGSFSNVEIEFAFTAEGQAVGMNVPAQHAEFTLEGFEKAFSNPLDAFPELSQATHKVQVDEKVASPMRDGAKLICDVVRPQEEGKYPVILIRTPYGRATARLGSEVYASRGYVVVAQDTRGRGDSEGEFDPLNTEVADGKDTLDWIAAQPWCDGNAGMIGASYGGYVQWAAAVTHHPLLKCIIPQVSPPEPTKNMPRENGAMFLYPALWWTRVVKDRNSRLDLVSAPVTKMKALNTLPITKVDDAFYGENLPYFDEWVKRDTPQSWAGAFTTTQVAEVRIPALQISGTWDGDGVGTMTNWAARRKGGKDQWLIFGPWPHGFNASTKFADMDYGPSSVIDLDSLYLRFFDTYLKGKRVGWDDQPRVRFFVAGANKWYTGSDWPAPESKPVTLFLIGKGSKRVLSSTFESSATDSYPYDPNLSVVKADQGPTAEGATTVVSADDKRKGLMYRSEPFQANTTYTGPLSADLFVSTTGRDATFHVMVMDEDSKGSLRLIAMMGTQRITYLSGKFTPVNPNQVVRVQVEPWLFAHRFAAGHRMAIFITSDVFPSFARNPGTGEPDWKATKLVKVVQSIYRSTKYPSSVHLWKLPGF